MKKYGIVYGLIGVLAILIGVFIFTDHQKEEKEKAQKEHAQIAFNAQLERNWETVLQDMNLMELRTQDPKQLKTFANFQYKRVGEIRFRKIDPVYKDEANEFMILVQGKTADLYKKLAMTIRKDNKDRLILQAKDVDDSLMVFFKKHPDYMRPPVNLESVLESSINRLVVDTESSQQPNNPAPSRIIVVASYPDWITTSSQKESWDSMRNIARDYFSERHRLSLEINWSQARRDPSYLLYDSVQERLDHAISIRQNLLSRLNNVESSEGMSDLGNKIGAMLQNSINSLSYAKNGDYATFKSYNNSNDAIQTEIRRTFNIR